MDRGGLSPPAPPPTPACAAQEVAAYRDLIDQMKGSGFAEPGREVAAASVPAPPGGRGAEEELRALQRQYSDLRGMYNALAMKQTR